MDKFDFSAPDFEIMREAARSYAGIAAFRNATLRAVGHRRLPSGSTRRASRPSIFSVLGVSPMLGRALTPDEDRDAAKVAVLSHGLWIRAFGRDPSIVGRAITLDRQPYTVIGVMPERFEFPPRGSANNGRPAALFVPIAFSPMRAPARSAACTTTPSSRG